MLIARSIIEGCAQRPRFNVRRLERLRPFLRKRFFARRAADTLLSGPQSTFFSLVLQARSPS